MDNKKMFLCLMTSLLIIFGSFSSVFADMSTSVPVTGTLYSQSEITTPTEPTITPTENPTTHNQKQVISNNHDNGRFGKFGDQSSNLMVIGGLMLILTAVGLMIRRRL